MIQTNDGGYAIAGYGFANLVKTDANGNVVWNQTYGGLAHSVVQTSDGGYALAGYTTSYATSYDFWLVKTDAAGNMQWSRKYGEGGAEKAYSLIQTNDGGYAIAGHTNSYGSSDDFWLIKTDPLGNIQWSRIYDIVGDDRAYSLIQTDDGGYAVAGSTWSSTTGDDVLLVKTDSSGNIQWNRIYGGIDDDYAQSVVQTDDRGYALAGCTDSYGAGYLLRPISSLA